MKTSRCAIYTRKSSEEGLDQSFNSLHAQREACEAYITSQKHEGWHALSAKYDDGGFSGGNMVRPGLKKLLEDIAAGKIDRGDEAIHIASKKTFAQVATERTARRVITLNSAGVFL